MMAKVWVLSILVVSIYVYGGMNVARADRPGNLDEMSDTFALACGKTQNEQIALYKKALLKLRPRVQAIVKELHSKRNKIDSILKSADTTLHYREQCKLVKEPPRGSNTGWTIYTSVPGEVQERFNKEVTKTISTLLSGVQISVESRCRPIDHGDSDTERVYDIGVTLTAFSSQPRNMLSLKWLIDTSDKTVPALDLSDVFSLDTMSGGEYPNEYAVIATHRGDEENDDLPLLSALFNDKLFDKAIKEYVSKELNTLFVTSEGDVRAGDTLAEAIALDNRLHDSDHELKPSRFCADPALLAIEMAKLKVQAKPACSPAN